MAAYGYARKCYFSDVFIVLFLLFVFVCLTFVYSPFN